MLHRETLYLAVSYFDRFMSVTRNIPKSRLQTIGITCLYIAAKVQVCCVDALIHRFLICSDRKLTRGLWWILWS